MRACVACILAGSVLLSTAAAKADPVSDFYKDKTLNVVSAGEAGGAHGAYGQMIAAHIRKYIPGMPNIQIQYMIGAGGNLSMNYLYNVAPKDGTAIGVPLQDLIFNARLGVTTVKYDAAKAHYLGGADVTRTIVTVMKASGVASIRDATEKEVLIGASGTSGQNYIIPYVLNALFGTKFRVVTGYPGINLIHLAMDRGEVQGTAASWPVIVGTHKEWIDKDLINNLVTIGMEREPELPDVPSLAELVKSPEDIELVRLLAGSAALGRAWVAFGDIPPDRLAALRDAFARTMVDPDFLAEARKRNLVVSPVTWQDQDTIARQILQIPDATVARLKRILGLD